MQTGEEGVKMGSSGPHISVPHFQGDGGGVTRCSSISTHKVVYTGHMHVMMQDFEVKIISNFDILAIGSFSS